VMNMEVEDDRSSTYSLSGFSDFSDMVNVVSSLPRIGLFRDGGNGSVSTNERCRIW